MALNGATDAEVSQVRPCDGERVEARRRRGQDVPRVPGLSPRWTKQGDGPQSRRRTHPRLTNNPCPGARAVPRPLDRQKSEQERDELVKQIMDYRRQLTIKGRLVIPCQSPSRHRPAG
jgi:hypothetical protein